MRIEMKIEGMSCSGCEGTVRKALLSVPGVKNASVSRESNSAAVDADISVKKGSLSAAVQRAGYKVQ